MRLGGGAGGRRWWPWALAAAALLAVALAGALRDRPNLPDPTDLIAPPAMTLPAAHTLRLAIGFGADLSLRAGDHCGQSTGMVGRDVVVTGPDGTTLGQGRFGPGEAQQFGADTRCVLSVSIDLPDAASYLLWYDYGSGLQVGLLPPLGRAQLDCLGWSVSPRIYVPADGAMTAAERCLGITARHE